MKNEAVQQIEQHYQIRFPQAYLDFADRAGQQAYNFTTAAGFIDWEIQFMMLDEHFITTNQELVDECNPDPEHLIPFAWSVSSGNNYLLDYRHHPDEPRVLLMDHDEAVVREDAVEMTDTPEQAQQMMEENVAPIADNIQAFLDALTEYDEDEEIE